MNGVHTQLSLSRSGFNLDVDFNLPGQGISALFGVSGSGKTTVLRCIAGLERAARGVVRINGDIWQQDKIFVPPHLRAVGYVFQEPSLFSHLDVRHNLEYAFKRRRTDAAHIGFDHAIHLLGIEQFLQRMPHQISGGQQQRVAIARALLTSPRLLLMDEPLASLDLNSKAEILPYLEQLHDELKIPVIYVSHAPAEVTRLADHLVLIEAGKVRAQGAINDLLTNSALPLAHLDEAGAVLHGKVLRQDENYHLTYVALSGTGITGGMVAVSHKDLTLGHDVRVRILARDVSIALQPPQHSSITNVLPVRVMNICPAADAAQAIVQLDLGGQTLLSRITRRSVDMLNLQQDAIVYAQVKSVALMK